jgi:hypothetical protein
VNDLLLPSLRSSGYRDIPGTKDAVTRSTPSDTRVFALRDGDAVALIVASAGSPAGDDLLKQLVTAVRT